MLLYGDFSGKNRGVSCHFLLQGIFLTQESNLHPLCLLHRRWILHRWVTGEAFANQQLILKKAQRHLTKAVEEALSLTQSFSALEVIPYHFLTKSSQLAPETLTLNYSWLHRIASLWTVCPTLTNLQRQIFLKIYPFSPFFCPLLFPRFQLSIQTETNCSLRILYRSIHSTSIHWAPTICQRSSRC